MNETYIKICGRWRCLYRAVDKTGRTVDFFLTSHRDRAAALRFLRKAAGQNGVPTLINIDKSGANQAGIKTFNANSRDGSAAIAVPTCAQWPWCFEDGCRAILPLGSVSSGLSAADIVRQLINATEPQYVLWPPTGVDTQEL